MRSTHSHRLYREPKADSLSKAQYNALKIRTPLYPELCKLRLITKEVSNSKIEINQGVTVPFRKKKRASFIVEQSNPVVRLQKIQKAFPEKIQKFLQKASGRYSTLSLQNGAVYVGDAKG